MNETQNNDIVEALRREISIYFERKYGVKYDEKKEVLVTVDD